VEGGGQELPDQEQDGARARGQGSVVGVGEERGEMCVGDVAVVEEGVVGQKRPSSSRERGRRIQC